MGQKLGESLSENQSESLRESLSKSWGENRDFRHEFVRLGKWDFEFWKKLDGFWSVGLKKVGLEIGSELFYSFLSNYFSQ